ncbi:MAG: diaminopimelate decarboxylase, partial [Candidatus Omnitrophota bacterium]
CVPRKIVYASVGKTESEIKEAVRRGILFFNVESLSELEAIDRIAGVLRKRAQVAIRINPDVEPHTHKYITTGKLTNKFGIDFSTARKIFLQRKSFANLRINGLHIHIGSQIIDSRPFVEAITRVARFAKELQGLGVKMEYLNIGGGLGIIYKNEQPQTAAQFASAVLPILQKTGLKVILEPGRFIVGNAGILVTRVIYIKQSRGKTFVIVDAGMNDLIRPALYDAYHEIVPLKTPRHQDTKTPVDVVGPICESADFFAKDRRMRQLKEGDPLAIMGAGAYGFSMSSIYNQRLRPAEVMIDGNRGCLIRRRDGYIDLIRGEILPKGLR